MTHMWHGTWWSEGTFRSQVSLSRESWHPTLQLITEPSHQASCYLFSFLTVIALLEDTFLPQSKKRVVLAAWEATQHIQTGLLRETSEKCFCCAGPRLLLSISAAA